MLVVDPHCAESLDELRGRVGPRFRRREAWPTQLACILGGAVAPLISVALLDRYDTAGSLTERMAPTPRR